MIDNTDMLIFWVVVLSRLLGTKLPPADWKLKLTADPLPEYIDERHEQLALAAKGRVLSMTLLEKIVLVSLISLIFGSILTGVRATTVTLYVTIAFVIIVNALLSHWLAQRGRGWGSIAREFLIMAVVNLGLVYLADFLLRRDGGSLNLQITLFFVLLLTLIVTLYDRYHLVYQARFAPRTKTQKPTVLTPNRQERQGSLPLVFLAASRETQTGKGGDWLISLRGTFLQVAADRLRAGRDRSLGRSGHAQRRQPRRWRVLAQQDAHAAPLGQKGLADHAAQAAGGSDD